MRNGGSGGGVVAVIAIIIGIVVFLLSRGSVSSLFRTVGWIILIIIILAIIALVLLVVFAARSSKKNPVGNYSSSRVRLSEEESAVINNGRQDLMAIRRKLVTIKNNEIRTKGNTVCSTMDRVFKILREKPEKIPNTRQFLNYYIPTVGKVISKYQRMEANGVPTGDMTEKMKKFLDDVNVAMDQQCTHLYEDDKLDMSVNMEAMTMAIKRDGLLDENDFPVNTVSHTEEVAAEDDAPKALTDDVIIPVPDTHLQNETEAVKEKIES